MYSLASTVAVGFRSALSSRKSKPALALWTSQYGWDESTEGGKTNLTTSAYASMALTFFLFFSAIGMRTFRAFSSSETLLNSSLMNVRR